MTKGFILLLLHSGSLWAPPINISDEFLSWWLPGHQSTPLFRLAAMEPSVTCRWTHPHTFWCPWLYADTHRSTCSCIPTRCIRNHSKQMLPYSAEVSGKNERSYHEQAKKWLWRRQDVMIWHFHPAGQPAVRGEGSSSHLGERSALCLFLSLGTAFTIVLGNNCQSEHQQTHLHLLFSPLKKSAYPSWQQLMLQTYVPSSTGKKESQAHHGKQVFG